MLIAMLYESFKTFFSPSKWPLWMRRAFVITSPVAIPLLIMVWTICFLVLVAGSIIGIGVCVAIDIWAILGKLWQRDPS